MKRLKLLLILAMMPDEAFNWLVLVLLPKVPMRTNQIWPDGMGGFKEKSRKSVKAIQEEALKYLNNE